MRRSGLVILPLILCYTHLLGQKIGTQKWSNKEGIIFASKTWEEVPAEAQKMGKFIFVDAYASWCAPCKQLKSTTFKNKSVASFFNTHFVNVSIDMEQGEGPELADRWLVNAYPTLIIFNPQGKMVLRQEGYMTARDLLVFGRQALSLPK
jgi:thiol:disulfide interchange protein